jgi:Tol biopolymer transport system component
LYTLDARTEHLMSSQTDARSQARIDPPEAAVRAELERILASEVFSRSQQLRRFLSFIVEQRLAREGHALKESVLAHELYGKGTGFDGGTDPVVRVDARRLRDKLREYYERRSDPIVISLPKGSYVPMFEVNDAHEIPAAVSVEPQRAPPIPKSRGARIAVAVIGVSAAVAIASRAFLEPAVAPAQLFPLASYPGVEGQPALSPDGNLVAFAWPGDAGDGPTDIYVKDVGSEAIRRLTQTLDSESSPAWSPDGHSIAFVREGRGVFTISQLGGAERQVSASGTQVAWVADSKSVLIRDREGDAGPFGIYQVALDSLARHRLTQAPVGDGDWRFEVSPDGNTLAFIRYEKRGIADLYVVPMRGGEPRRLTNWSAAIEGLSWTPDSREIVYDVDEPPASRLWRIDANSATPARGSPIASMPAAATNPSISRPTSGHPARLAFQSIARDVDLHLMDLATHPVNDIIASQRFSDSTRIESSARFSPDGSRVAFASLRSGAHEIWIAGRDGTNPQQVTTLGAPGVFVGGWAPDASRLVFEAAVDGNTDVYVIGVDGGHLRRLTTEASIDGVPSWSMDGRWIYFASTRAGVIADVWRVPAEGGEAVRLTHHGGFEPRESPDGRYLFYLDQPPAALASGATARLMRLPLAGGDPETVLDGVRPFLWSVTTSGIVFVTREPEFDAIDTYRFSDRRITRLGRLGFRIPGIYTYMTASPDGRWMLATNLVHFDSDLMRLDNFR